MRGLVAVFKRELFSYFVTPLAWVLLTSFLVFQGAHFFVIVMHYANLGELSLDGGPVQGFFGGTILIYLPLLLVCPLLTMRTFAEERKSGTIEALLTAPVTPAGVVLGKYLATLTVYLATWLPTVLYVVTLSRFGEVDWRIVATSYAAIAMAGAGYLAIGTLSSALTTSQLTAAVVASIALLFLFLLALGEFVFDPGVAHDVCAHVSVWSLMNDFSRGLVDSRRLVFYGTLVVLPLFITVRTVESWRWG
jgi:ABC-2 type transport system permease protein